MLFSVVCDTAKVRFFKQITTYDPNASDHPVLFAILQKYDFSSKSQHNQHHTLRGVCCLRYCKSTIFQANHNPRWRDRTRHWCCLRYCKSTIFQANHNSCGAFLKRVQVVCDTAKVRFFKQITTDFRVGQLANLLFAILQKYDFSSKSQQFVRVMYEIIGCLRYCKSTIFQANHNCLWQF